MIKFNQFSVLALGFLFLSAQHALAADKNVNILKRKLGSDRSERPTKKRRVGQGHQSVVNEASPMKKSPQKLAKDAQQKPKYMQAVLKRRLPHDETDMQEQAQKQSAVRKLVQEKYTSDDATYRHIPKIERADMTTIKMERAMGENLGDVLDRLSVPEFLNLMKSIMVFMANIHRLGYAHDDLSPNNIMVDPANLEYFRVIDWELAGVFGNTRKMSGALNFSAPEVRSGEFITAHGDVFSLGKIIALYFECFLVDDELYELINLMTALDFKKRIDLADAIEKLETILLNNNLDYKLITPLVPSFEPETIQGYI